MKMLSHKFFSIKELNHNCNKTMCSWSLPINTKIVTMRFLNPKFFSMNELKNQCNKTMCSWGLPIDAKIEVNGNTSIPLKITL